MELKKLAPWKVAGLFAIGCLVAGGVFAALSGIGGALGFWFGCVSVITTILSVALVAGAAQLLSEE